MSVLEINLDSSLRDTAELQLDAGAMEALAVEIGVVEAIKRRTGLNPEVPSTAAINFNSISKRHWAYPVGRLEWILGQTYFNRRRTVSDNLPPADIDINVGSIISSIGPDESEHDRQVAAAVERITIHELFHFADPDRDFWYKPGVSLKDKYPFLRSKLVPYAARPEEVEARAAESTYRELGRFCFVEVK